MFKNTSTTAGVHRGHGVYGTNSSECVNGLSGGLPEHGGGNIPEEKGKLRAIKKELERERVPRKGQGDIL